MVFINVDLEKVVQVDDKTRIDCTKTFVAKGSPDIQTLTITPSALSSPIDVTGSSSRDWFLDWSYDSDGTQTITVQANDGVTTYTKIVSLPVVTAVDDRLFSSDDQLLEEEPEITKWIVEGRNSFLDVHRRAKELILSYFDTQGYRNLDGSKITDAEIIDISEVSEWSKYLALHLIFKGRSNTTDDIFSTKSKLYEGRMIEKRDRVFLAYDWNKDGSLSFSEKQTSGSTIEVVKE